MSGDRAAILVAAGILLSRISGLIREIVMSAVLGASTVAAEAFAFALGVPKILQNLLGEGALSASFIPVYSQVVDENPAAARRLAGAVFAMLAALVGILVLVLMLAADPIISVLARGAGPERAALTADLLRVMAPGIGFIVFAAWCLGILNAHREFFRSYVAPVLWNVAIVIAIVVWRTQTDALEDLARAAAWGVFIGGIAQFAVQLPRVLAIAGPITPSLRRDDPATTQVMRRFVPGVAGRGVVTISTFVDLALSSFLAVGALAVLTKAQTLYLMPISVFAISIAAADLPELSREAGDDAAAHDRVRRAVDRVTFFLVFSTLAFVLGGRSLVGALFERGAFDGNDTVAVWVTLAVFSFGLLASGLSRLLQNAAFAHGDVGGPARIALVRLVLAAVVGILLMWPADRFAVANGVIERVGTVGFGPLDDSLRDQPGTHRLGAVGLAAGGAVAAWAEFVLLRRRVGSLARGLGIGRALLRLIPAVVVAGVALVVLDAVLNGLHPLLAAPLVVGPPGLAYVLLAERRGSATASALLGRVRSLVATNATE
jgi:putative peptidoglycan lipid II flippase